MISLDFELIWGTLDRPDWRRMGKICEVERQVVVDRLLGLFAEFGVSATLCIVGHLFLDSCACRESGKHPEIPRAANSVDELRFDRDPCGTEHTHGIFYGRRLLDKILACRVVQEIGCHSFTHVLFNERTCSYRTAESEIAASVEAARRLGIELRSFVFPRNQVGFVDLLGKYGFTCYREPDPIWYETVANRKWYHGLAHYADVLRAAAPPVVEPRQMASGIWSLPGSMLYTPSVGLRRFIPVSLRVARAKKGLVRAVQEQKIFHLWFHPTDLVVRMDDMLDGLRQILRQAAEFRDAGSLKILNMSGVVDEVSSPAMPLAAMTY